MSTETIRNGQTIRLNVLPGQSVAVLAVFGTYNASIVQGAGIGVIATAATGATYGPYASGIVINLTASAASEIDFDIAVTPAIVSDTYVISDNVNITGGAIANTSIEATTLSALVPGTAGIAVAATLGVTGNGGAGRGAAVLLRASGSTSSVDVVRLVGLQETAAATANNASFVIQVADSTGAFVERLRINNAGELTVSKVRIAAGVATANGAPEKFTSGPLLTTPEVGAEEFLTNDRYYTGTDGTRRRYAVNSDVIRLKGFTVAGLPAGTQGDKAFVTDALAPTYLAAIVGGGAVVTEVFFNGTAWVST